MCLRIAAGTPAASKELRAKAQSDSHSRTKDPLGLDPKTTTLVAVTSHLWRERDD